MPLFDSIDLLPDDPILSIPFKFAADSSPKKVNLGVGAYRNSEGKPTVLSCVRKAEKLIWEEYHQKQYLPIEGRQGFIDEALCVVYGNNNSLLESGRIFGVQTIGASGALRIVGQFLAHHETTGKVFVSSPTWSNHQVIFKHSGLQIEEYPYYSTLQNGLDFDKMCDAIEKMPPKSVILFHGCCHNPTGVDPSSSQWRELSQRVLKRELIPLFDLAYQGFDRDLDSDAEAIRVFAKDGHTLFVATSFSKNLGLYGERCGLLSVVAEKPNIQEKIASHFKKIIRGSYSTPPQYPALIAETVMKSPELRAEWLEELTQMRERIQEMRRALAAGLITKVKTKDFSFLKGQTGMFSYTGLSEDQVLHLKQDHHIYMPKSGRINIAGLTHHNLDDVIDAIATVL